MTFIETVRAVHLMRLWIRPAPVLCREVSVGARLCLALGRRLGFRAPELDRLVLGHVETATNVRQAAFELAERTVAMWPGEAWAAEESAHLGIDVGLIARKQRFERAYEKFLFLELVLRYTAEHPESPHHLEVDAHVWESYEARRRAAAGTVRVRTGWPAARFVAALCLLPLVVLYHRWRSGTTSRLWFERSIVCAVDGEQTVAMFQRLFADDARVRFVVEPAYASAFSGERRAALGIEVLGLVSSDASAAFRRSFSLAVRAWRHRAALVSEGEGVLLLWHSLLQGRALAVHGPGNVFVTFEHLIHMRGVRNEFLRAEGSASLFVPKNSYVTYRHYPAEAWQNYDVIGCAGPHAAKLYRWKHAVTRRFEPLGSYDAHLPEVTTDTSTAHQDALREFARGATLVTVLSPGICDETYSAEVRLMALVRHLARHAGIRVAVRPKPVALDAKYAGFYDEHLQGATGVLVTPPEFALSDFPGVTGLFVTSISSSACDLALRGADVLFVDFMKTPDLYVPWLQVPEAVADESSAYDRIVAWARDEVDGPVRREHRHTMDRLRSCLGYAWPDFETYRAQVRACVESLL